MASAAVRAAAATAVWSRPAARAVGREESRERTSPGSLSPSAPASHTGAGSLAAGAPPPHTGTVIEVKSGCNTG